MLSNNIKNFRKEKGFSQQELAEKSGASLASVVAWESGKNQKIRQGNLEKLATALETSVEALLADQSVVEKDISEFTKTICNRIKETRKKRKLKQEDAAEKLGITKFEYADLENGEVEPELEQLKALAELFETSLDEIFGIEKPVAEEEEMKQEVAKVKQERWIKHLAAAPEETREAMKKIWSAVNGLSDKEVGKEDSKEENE